MNKTTVIDHFKWYYKKGYITARDGNAAYRWDGNQYMVTASGTVKNELKTGDFCLVDAKGLLTGKKPSIETGAHVAALNSSKKNASVHVHSPNTVALAALFEHNPHKRFKPTERDLVDVLNKNWPELFRYTSVGYIVPFLNPGSQKLHDVVESALSYWGEEFIYDKDGEPEQILDVKKYHDIVIMQRHGVLATGKDLDECMEHIVRLEHISGILLKIVTASGSTESIL